MGRERRVFVGTDEVFHATLSCARAKGSRTWCDSSAAHRSRLKPCDRCARELARELAASLGSIPSGARRSLGLPKLNPIEGRAESDGSSDDERDADLYYGTPESLEDPRFANRSLLDWGTASYGQDPDEFLGGPTDDDNDWRGGGSLYE